MFESTILVRFGLVSLFNGVSKFVGYLMPKHTHTHTHIYICVCVCVCVFVYVCVKNKWKVKKLKHRPRTQ